MSSTFPLGGAGHLPFAFADFPGCFSLQFVTGINGMDASGSVSGLVLGLLVAGAEGDGIVGIKTSRFVNVDPVADDMPAMDTVEG